TKWVGVHTDEVTSATRHTASWRGPSPPSLWLRRSRRRSPLPRAQWRAPTARSPALRHRAPGRPPPNRASSIRPAIWSTLDRRVVRKIARQQPPLTTRPRDVEQRVDHRQQRGLSWPPSRRGAGNQGSIIRHSVSVTSLA